MSDTATATPVDLLRSLAVLAEPPTPEVERLAPLVGLAAVPSVSDYADVFLFQLYPYASAHLGAEGMLGGEARARIAGFWHAVGQRPPAEPDHLAALLGLYVSLAERGAGASTAEAVLRDEACAALLHEHVAPWVFAYLERVQELAGEAYAGWAERLCAVLRAEVEQRLDGDRPLPVHLQAAPALPDPRTDGGEAFVKGLLSPVRSGIIVTRADLAQLAGRVGLGLRAGERRYALEHLLGLDPGPVLMAIGDAAARQSARHAARRSWLGETAEFWRARAEACAALCRELAEATAPAGNAPATTSA